VSLVWSVFFLVLSCFLLCSLLCERPNWLIVIINVAPSCICRHVVFAPSVHNSYAAARFPSIVDSLVEVQQFSDDSEAAWYNVEQQLSVVTFLIDTAAASLAPPSEF